VLLCLAAAVAGCSAGSKQGASQGAKSGALGGLVAGAVGSIFWGGDAVNNALRTAAVGAASGAAVGAMNGAEKASASETDPKRKSYALLIEAMAAEESNNAGKAHAVYAEWARFDPSRADVARLRNDALEGLLKVQKIRQERGLPILCT